MGSTAEEAGAAIAAAATLGRGNLDQGFNLALTGPPGGLSRLAEGQQFNAIPVYPYVEGVYAFNFTCGIYNCDRMIVETNNSWLGITYDERAGRYKNVLVCEDKFRDDCNAVERYDLSPDNAFNVTSWEDWFNRFDRRFDRHRPGRHAALAQHHQAPRLAPRVRGVSAGHPAGVLLRVVLVLGGLTHVSVLLDAAAASVTLSGTVSSRARPPPPPHRAATLLEHSVKCCC